MSNLKKYPCPSPRVLTLSGRALNPKSNASPDERAITGSNLAMKRLFNAKA